MNLKIYPNRNYAATKDPIEVSLTETSESQAQSEDQPQLPFRLRSFNAGGLTVYALDTSVFRDPEQVMALSVMVIPNFFKNVEDEIHGLFLTPIGKPNDAKDFLLDHALGKYGCPRTIKVNDEVDPRAAHFRFNGQSFYPFIMTDFTIGYYVRDTVDVPKEWPMNDNNVYVGVDDPITFDATLGLYITRGAHIVVAS